MGRKPCFSREGLYKGPWTPEEDFLLVKYIQAHGVGRWRTLPRNAGLNRCGKSCRFRWMNYLRPDIKRGHISAEEEELIIRLHNILGNRWSLIARRIPGRTDNEVKNYWNTHLRKRFKESNANELINAEVDNIHMLNHNSITTTQGYSNEMACMEPYDSNTEMGAAQFDCNRLFQFDCNGVVEVEGENQISQNAGLDSIYAVHGSSCLSSLNWTCDQSIEGMEWSVGELQALLLGYELETAQRFQT